MKNFKETYGITLIALIITVVIMLILAGVAIAAVVDGDGLFNRTKQAVEAYENAAEKEEEDIQKLLNEIDNYLNGVSGEDPLVKLPDGSFDAEKGVNMPDTSKLPSSTTKYVTWNYNETDSIYEEQISDNAPENWYDYDNGKWANIKTVANDLEAYWVWIPRFAYKLPESSTAKEIEVAFIKNNGTETVEGERAYYSTDTEITKDGSGLYAQATEFAKGTMENNEQAWIVHPAFTFGDKQLNGIWVAKYEASNPDCTNDVINGEYNRIDKQVEIKPNVTSWRGITLSNEFKVCQNIKIDGTIGATNNVDTHLMKNIEWGAVGIISQSKYGIYNSNSLIGLTENGGDGTLVIWTNPNSSYITGTVGNTSTAKNLEDAECIRYNEKNGPKASTTGTVYGIYDMSGGAWDMVMGIVERSLGSNIPSNANTGFENWPSSKYYDIYSFYQSDVLDKNTFNRGKIGDLTTELQVNFENGEFSWHEQGFDSGAGSGPASSTGSFHPVMVNIL